MKVLRILGIAAILAGCATPSTFLVNNDGQMIRCYATGWGYVGAPMAAVSHDQCVSDYRKVGYFELPDVVLGVRFDAASPPQITSTDPGSPAAQVGILRGDLLQSVEGLPVKNYRDLANVLRQRKAGDRVSVVVVREGSTLEFTPALAQR
jgi:S1-C subfamily serine protease